MGLGQRSCQHFCVILGILSREGALLGSKALNFPLAGCQRDEEAAKQDEAALEHVDEILHVDGKAGWINQIIQQKRPQCCCKDARPCTPVHPDEENDQKDEETTSNLNVGEALERQYLDRKASCRER